MSLTLTTDTLRAAYNYLCETKPYCDWNLPDGDDVRFRIIRDPTRFGKYQMVNGKHVISISIVSVGMTATLMEKMGHEMIHLHDENAEICSRNEHGVAFKRFAQQACRVHGWDVKAF